MASFETESPINLIGLAKRKLGDDLATGIARVRVKDAYSDRNGPFSYSLAVGQEIQIELFNDAGDRDRAHGIIGKISKRDRSRKVGWSPLIEAGKNGAWLKYSTKATARQTAKSGSDVILGLQSTEDAEHFYYHRHRRNKLLVTAISADLADQKSAFSLDDVLSLNRSQVAGFATAGKVRLSFKIDWADLLASGMTRLAGLLETSGAVEISLTARGSAAFEISIADQFKLVFVGMQGEKFRVALRRSRSSGAGAAVKAGMEIKFARPSAISHVLDQVVAGLLGVSPQKFDALVTMLRRKVSLESLPRLQQDLLESVIEKLELEDRHRSATEVLDVLDDFASTVNDTLTDIARTSAGMSFAYDYSTLSTDASIYEGVFSRPALKALFPDLLAGQFQSVLSAEDKQPGEIKTVHFLNEKSLVIKDSIGLSLGLGNASISGRERTVFRFTTQQNANGAIRHSLLGDRRYQGKLFGPYESTRVQFKADMPDFAPAGAPLLVDAFRFAFAVTYQDDRAWSSQARLKSLLDMCLLCGIAPEGDLESLADRVRDRFGRRKTRSVLTLRLSHGAVLGFSDWLSNSPDETLASIIAGAMDYSDRRVVLQLVHSRRYLYTGFWREALRQYWQDPYQASRFALGVLAPVDSSLYRAEKQALRRRGRDSATLFMLLRRNPDLLVDLKNMRQAFAQLHRASAANSTYEVLADITRNIHAFTNSRFKTRVTGALVGAYQFSDSAPSRGINTALVIKAAKGDEAMTFGRKR